MHVRTAWVVVRSDPFLRQNATLTLEFVFRIRLRILRISYKGDFGRRNAYF